MPLLEYLTLIDYRKIKSLTLKQCEKLAKLAKLKICLNDVDFPGIHLVLHLDSIGYSIDEYNELMIALEYFIPQAKVAILIANDVYVNLPRMTTSQSDRVVLGAVLMRLGFLIINIKNTVATQLKILLSRFSELIPEDSFCFIFYGGYGCQIGSTKCMLGVNCPVENVEMEHCVTENDIMIILKRCKPDLCVLIMDFSLVHVYIERSPLLHESLKDIEEYRVHRNLLIGYFTHPHQSAYDTRSRNSRAPPTNELRRPVMSQYVTALCTRLSEKTDISSILAKVHKDMEDNHLQPKPLKVQYGTTKRFFCERFKVNTQETVDVLTNIAICNDEVCSVYM